MNSPFAVGASTDARLLRRGCESLLGIAAGLVADGELNAKEIQFLSVWLAEHQDIASTWPGEVVHKRIREVLSDGVVTDSEIDYLRETLIGLVGGNFSDSGAIPADAATLPTDGEVIITIQDAFFCFTGNFLFGTRSACEKAVESRGGRICGIGKKLQYLVVGELSSREWKYSSFGTKIESAMRIKAEGNPLAIVSEAQWVRAL